MLITSGTLFCTAQWRGVVPSSSFLLLTSAVIPFGILRASSISWTALISFFIIASIKRQLVKCFISYHSNQDTSSFYTMEAVNSTLSLYSFSSWIFSAGMVSKKSKPLNFIPLLWELFFSSYWGYSIFISYSILRSSGSFARSSSFRPKTDRTSIASPVSLSMTLIKFLRVI